MDNKVIGVFAVCNTAGICVHEIDHAEDRVLASMNGIDPEWYPINIAFVYNNRVREYDLGTGKMIVNQQVRNARGKEYLGKDITKKFIGKVVHRD